MTDILFYHLERTTLEKVLPGLLEKSLERGWRAVVQATTEERIESLDSLLWTFSDTSFLPHGTSKDGVEDRHPVFLTQTDINPNAANIRFLVENANVEDMSGYERVVYLFDGNDEYSVSSARESYRSALDSGHDVTYWQQSETGKWEKRA
ncbi:MAG: DNA polymerase III subunit chi [Methyloligellaceae bacterium]